MRHKLSMCLAFSFLLPFAGFAGPSMESEPKKPIAVVQPAPSVRVEGGAALTVAPLHGEGMPGELAISGADAHDFLRAEALKVRSDVHLYTLSTGMHALSPEGKSSGWVADFLTDTPGELLTVVYDDGQVDGPFLASAPPGRAGSRRGCARL